MATRAAHAEPEPGVSLDVWPGWAPGRDPIDVWAISKLPQDLFGTTFVIPDGAAANRGGVPVGDWHGQVRIGGGLFVLPMPRVVSAERGDPPKIWMDDRCFSVTAPTAFPVPGYSNHAFPEGALEYGLLGLRAGATLRWPDDTEAGRVLGELMLEEPASVGELTCGNWSLWWNRTPSVRVCVSTSDLERVAFWTTDPHTAVEWSRIGGVSSVRRSVMADALVALDRAVAACLSDVAPRSAFEVSFTLKDGVAPTAAVKSVPPEGPVPACLARALQKIVLPPKSSGRPKVSLRWNG